MKGKGALPCLLGQNRRHVVVGAAAVDDQRQPVSRAAAIWRRKPGLLVLRRLRVVEIVEAGLADRDDLLMGVGETHQVFGLISSSSSALFGCVPTEQNTDG
jgi:hypothetical protein